MRDLGAVLREHHRHAVSRSAVVLPGIVAVLALSLVPVASAETLTVHVDVEPVRKAGAAPSPGEPLELAVSYGGEEERTEVRSVAVPGRVAVEVPAGEVARITLSARGFWASPQVVHVDGPSAVRAVLRPTGWIAGSLRVPGGEEVPDRLRVRVRPAPDDASGKAPPGAGPVPPEGPWDCPVEEGAFRCEVPRGRLDLRLRAKGFVSHHRWSVDVPAHDTVSLGALDLRPGASIVGWVEAPAQDFQFDQVRVRVRPLAAGSAPSSRDRERRASLRLEAPVNPRGFFEVASVVPGSYEVTVEHEDFATARMAPVTVLERAETEIHRIRLEPPVELEVVLTPPAHPFRRPWYVELLQRGDVPGHLDVVEEGVSTPEGRWSRHGLAPGAYEIRVGNGHGARWATRQVTLGPGRPPVEVELPFERLEGSVRMGGEPVPATLFFGGRHGRRRIPIRSDDDGKFYVFLPRREGSWFADVVAPDLGIDVRVPGIEVRKLPGEPWAKTEIDLPDTRIFGTVVDGSGAPLGGAVVEVLGSEGETVASTHSSQGDGEFRFLGLEAGPAWLQARRVRSGRRLSSHRVAVEIRDRDEARPVRMVLFEDVEIEGLVVASHGGGVPGARVMARLDSSQRPLLSVMPSTTTDVDGVFTLRLPQGAERVILSVLAPGYAVRSLPVDVSAGRPLIVDLDSAGGTVVVSYAGGDWVPPVLRRHRTELFHPHLVAQSSALRRWAEGHGEHQGDRDRYVIPMLEPGPYTACYDVGFGVLTTGWLPPGGLPDRCTSGMLAPHAELHLTVPVPRAEEHPAAK